jgi:hypothetical protein
VIQKPPLSWANFCPAKLTVNAGNSFRQVEKDLGAGQANGSEEVLYLISEPKKSKGKDEPGTQLILSMVKTK